MKKIFPMFSALLLLFTYSCARADAQGDDSCAAPVNTAEGQVTGAQEKGFPACVYKGIPYAAPPVGELRFKPPQPAAKRGSVLNAVAFGPQCMQPNVNALAPLVTGFSKQSEDCLYLNIWRPKTQGSLRLPVMVWIHGGDLLQGSGGSYMYGGSRLAAEKDLVLVTIAYRLGPFGYLYHPALAAEDPHSSAGNYGLMDQVRALEWVRDNISNFGGDPNNLTIFGQSAGGWAVCHLLASPLANGLFSRAIIQSGGCEAARTIEQGKAYGEEFAKRLGCAGENAAACLRAQPPKAVIGAMGKDWQEMLAKFFPHIDGYALKAMPLEALRSGAYNRVPLMAGSTRDEFKLFANEIEGRNSKSLPELKSAFEVYLRAKLGDELFTLYPPDKYPKPKEAIYDAAGDAYIGCPTFRAAAAASAFEPSFYYRFDFDDIIFPRMIGAAHAMEVPLVFGNYDVLPMSLLYSGGQEKKAAELSETMMAYWANFAKTGDPAGPGLPEWKPYSTISRSMVYLNAPTHPGKESIQQKCDYWSKQPIVIH